VDNWALLKEMVKSRDEIHRVILKYATLKNTHELIDEFEKMRDAKKSMDQAIITMTQKLTGV
jgi:cell fate (sporulation/competence/biofilm development) regulator YlbF (YheA/YmcA/DUF963 family)